MAAASESLVFTSSQYTEPTQEVVYSSNNEESSDSEETDANGLTDHDDGHDYENDSVETLSGDDSDSSSDEAGEEEQEQEGRCGLAANGGDYAMAEGAQSGQGPSSEAQGHAGGGGGTATLWRDSVRKNQNVSTMYTAPMLTSIRGTFRRARQLKILPAGHSGLIASMCMNFNKRSFACGTQVGTRSPTRNAGRT